MATVTFDKATRLFPGSERPAVDALDIEIGDGEFLVLVGPSGCGKSTSLRMLAGLEEVNGGAIRIGERDVTNLAPKDRDIAMVFQNYALYPHMSVADNMGFALKIAGEPKDEIRERVAEAAKILDLEQYLDRKPKALSGGQRQRVAMGRAIVRQPQVFLMDEPLSNLDAKLRVQTRTQIAALQRRLGVTTVYVTHDQVEAMTMGDRVAVLKDGILQQVDTPRHMYDNPNNVFVAGFIGSPAMNLLKVNVEGNMLHFGGAALPVPRETAAEASKAGQEVTLGVRPEDMEPVGERPGPDDDGQRGRGARRRRVRLRHAPTLDGRDYDIIARVDGRKPPAKGETSTSRRSRATCTCSRPPPASGCPPDRAGLAEPHRRNGGQSCRCRSRGAGRPRAARPAVGRPAGGVAGRPAGRPAAGHLAARRALRAHQRRRVRRQGGRRAAGPRTSTPAAPAGAAGPALRRGGRRRHRAARTADGKPLEPALVTRHLQFSLPYRALFSATLRPDTVNRLLDALSALLVRLHPAASTGATARCRTPCSGATPAPSRRTSWTPRPASCTPSSPTGSAGTTSSWPA